MQEVFWSPVTAMHVNRPNGCIVNGVPGGGKSFFLLNVAANSLEQGCDVFVIDGKDDMNKLRNIFPNIKLTDVNNISPGSLDPFLVLDDPDTTTILSIIETICGKLDTKQSLAVSPVIGDFVNISKRGGEGANFRALMDFLYQHENEYAQSIGNSLMLASQSRFGKLMFGELGKRSVGMSIDDTSRVVSLLGMSLPTGESAPKADERVNLAIVLIICKMLKNMLTKKKSKGKVVNKTPTVLILDECHILMKSQAIADIIDEFLVLGRSLGIAVILSTQNVTHFGVSIAQHLSTKICFKMSKSEAEEFFEMFDNTTSGQSLDRRDAIETVTRLKVGYCMMIDREERCALVHIISNYNKNGDITSNPLMQK